MTRAFLATAGKAAELPFNDAIKVAGDAELTWLHIDGRDTPGATWLAAQDDLPSIAQTALTAQETRPRCEIVGEGALINLRGLGATPQDDPDSLVSVRFWAQAGRVISVSFRSPLALEPVIDEFLAGRIADPGDLISEFARVMTTELDPRIAAIGDALDHCETILDRNRIPGTRREVAKLRSEAISYRRFISPQRQALDRLASAPFDWFDDDDRHHLRDGADRCARMAEELEAIRERAALLHDELTDLRSEQLDARSLMISIVALIFLPLTFITGLLGMNVSGIPYAQKPWAFWGVVALCVIVALGVLGWFVRARWVRRR